MSSGLLYFWWEVSDHLSQCFLMYGSFFFVLRFSFIFGFKLIDYNEPRRDFLYIYPDWGCWATWKCTFLSFTETGKLRSLFFKYFFQSHFIPLLLWVLNYTWLGAETVHYIIIFPPHPSLFFRLNDFYRFKFIDSSFTSNLLLSPTSDFFILVFLILEFVFFIVSVSLEISYLFTHPSIFSFISLSIL